MDLVYMSDALSYHSIRTPIYDRYDYKQNNFNKGGGNKSVETDSHRSGSKCPICKEKQKRKLANYIKNKCSSGKQEENRIVEEEEEETGGCGGAH